MALSDTHQASITYKVICDAIGYCYQLSQLNLLSRGKIPPSEYFLRMEDYEPQAIIQNLEVKDVCCTKDDWIARGRSPTDIYTIFLTVSLSKGQEPFLSMEDVPLRQEARAMKTLRRLENFPKNLLGLGNEMIGKIMASVFGAMAQPTRGVLSGVRQLQIIEILLQNMLFDMKGLVMSNLFLTLFF